MEIKVVRPPVKVEIEMEVDELEALIVVLQTVASMEGRSFTAFQCSVADEIGRDLAIGG